MWFVVGRDGDLPFFDHVKSGELLARLSKLREDSTVVVSGPSEMNDRSTVGVNRGGPFLVFTNSAGRWSSIIVRGLGEVTTLFHHLLRKYFNDPRVHYLLGKR
jgi:hypothetical protein